MFSILVSDDKKTDDEDDFYLCRVWKNQRYMLWPNYNNDRERLLRNASSKYHLNYKFYMLAFLMPILYGTKMFILGLTKFSKPWIVFVEQSVVAII